jgi:nucleotide-binding universal stress UspA family protein
MYKHILVAVDDSPTAAKALTEAAYLARTHGASLEIVHAVDEVPFRAFGHYGGSLLRDAEAVRQALEQEGQAILAQAAARADLQGLDCRQRVLTSEQAHADEQIAQAIADSGADLVVVGSHGRRGVRHLLLGSVAERLVRKVPISILIVRGEGT